MDLKLDLRGDEFPSGPGMLELMTSGYLLSSVLFTAVELGIFDALRARPSEANALAKQLEASPEGIARLLSALCSMGLCRRDSDGLYHDTELAAAALTAGAPDSIVPLVLHHKRHLFPLFARLTEGVRTGKTQLDAWPFASGATDCYAEIARHPSEQELLTRAMSRGAVGTGRAIAQKVDLADAHHLIDLGGGGAQIAIELAESLPNLSITIVDLPQTCRHAQGRIEAAGLNGRIRCHAGDLRRPLENEAADAVLLAGVMSDFPASERAAVLKNAAQLVKPNGRLILAETLFNQTRTAPAMASILSLFMLLATRGDNFTVNEIALQLNAVGFSRLEILRNGSSGLRDLVVAQREG